MTEDEKKAAAEAILFASGRSVKTESIAKALEISASETEKILTAMAEDYEQADRGIRLLRLESSWQLCTKKEYYPALIRIVKEPEKANLTDVLMETLAIIAYRQPVTKLQIEKIRGVKSDHAVNKLIEYNLVRELGRMDAPGRPILFGTTEEFLRHFELSSLEQLPQVGEEEKKAMQQQAQDEAGREAQEQAAEQTREKAENNPEKHTENSTAGEIQN